MLGLSALVLVVFSGAALWYLRSLPRPVSVSESRGSSGFASAASASPSASPAVVLVDVAGWVRRPGVYELREGDRVIDAIDAAGGARSGAALDALNLAAPLVDGTQILVPKASAVAPPVGAAPGATPGGTALININTASAADLETLSGIGVVLAQRIVDYRTQNGPFTSVDGLLDVSGIGDATLAEIRDDVTV